MKIKNKKNRFTASFTSIKSKLLLIFLLVGLIPAVVIGIFAMTTTKNELMHQTSNYLRNISEAKEGQVYAYIDSIESRTIDFSSDGFIRDSLKNIDEYEDVESTTNALNSHLVKNKQSLDETLIGIFVTDENGIIVASTNEDEIGKNEGGDDYFVEGRKGVFVAEFESYHHFNIETAFVVSAPIFDTETNELLGVIVNVFDTTKLNKILSGKFQLDKGALSSNLGQTETLEVYIVNSKKEMFVNPVNPQHKHSSKMIADTLPVNECAKSNEIIDVYQNYANKEVIGASMCILSRKWTLVSEISTQEAFAAVNRTYFRMGVITAIFVFLIVVIALVISHTISKPIKKLQQGANIVAKGNLNYHVDVKTNDEIKNLASAFNSMTIKLKKSYTGLEHKVKERTSDLELSKKEVEKEKEKFRMILTNIGDGICVIDINENVLVINRAAETIFNQKGINVIGKNMWKFFHLNGGEKHKEFSQWKQGKVVNLNNITLHVAHGEAIPVSFNITPIKEVKGSAKAAVITFRDLTEEKKINNMKSEVIAVASHHLRTPLTAMRWQLEMLGNKSFGKLSKKQTDIVEKSLLSHTVMLNLVNDLLNVTEIDAGKFKLEPTAVQLENLIVDVVKSVREISAKDEVKIKIPKFTKKLPQVKVDRDRFRDVIRIIVENAVKYCKKGKTVTIGYRPSHDKKSVIFSVKDEGIGIPLNVQKYIFSKFYRTAHGEIGAGLKLFIAKSIITESSGKIWFESEEGKGSTFYFSLPVA